MWHSLVVRLVRDQEAAGSNPVTPTNDENRQNQSFLNEIGADFLEEKGTAFLAAYSNRNQPYTGGKRIELSLLRCRVGIMFACFFVLVFVTKQECV